MAGQEVGSASASGGATLVAESIAVDGGSLDTTIIKSQDSANARPGGGQFALAMLGTTTSSQPSVAFQTVAAWAVGRSYFVSVAFKFSAMPTNATTTIFRWSTNGGGNGIALIKVTSAGKIRLTDSVSAQIGVDSSTVLTAGNWYVLQSKLNINSAGGADDTIEVKIYDVSAKTTETVASSTTATLSTAAPNAFCFGVLSAPGAINTLYMDDVILNDDQGAANNGYPDPREVIIALRPVSDNARGNFTGGAGGTTNLWDALNDVPPTGKTSAAATDTSQIKDLTSSATDNADFNCESYASKSITSADTITSVMAAANCGSAAGVNLVASAAVVSNPVVAEGTDNNATAIGTWSVGWTNNWPCAVPVNNPSVTLGTQPVLRIGKRTASATGLHCAAAAILVGVVKALGPSPGDAIVTLSDAVAKVAVHPRTVSDAISAVSPGTPVPTKTLFGVPSGGVLSLSGTQKVGSTLTATNSGWSNSPSSYTYTWQRSASPAFTSPTTIQGPTTIAGTTNTYTLVAADDGMYVRCTATATGAGGTSNPVNTAVTAQITYPAPANSAAVAISTSGGGLVSVPINVTPGTWSP